MATVTVHRGRRRRAVAGRGRASLARRLRREIEGEVLFDAFSRGRYGTDASIYQVEPVGVVVPRSDRGRRPARSGSRRDGGRAGAAARRRHLAERPDGRRGAGHRHQQAPRPRPGGRPRSARRVRVEPGLVLDAAEQGAASPTACSSRSTPRPRAGPRSAAWRPTTPAARARCATARWSHNVLARSTPSWPTARATASARCPATPRRRAGPALSRPRAPGAGASPRARRTRSRAACRSVLRQVGGYNLDTVDPAGHNMAHLLVGSEGTLAFFTALELHLEPLPAHKVVGVCHFPTFRAAMEATRPHRRRWGRPRSRSSTARCSSWRATSRCSAPTLESFVRGQPDALLLVEFAGERPATSSSAASRRWTS